MDSDPAGREALLIQRTASSVGSVAGPPEKLVPEAWPGSRLVLIDEQSALLILHPNS